jgi:hypothetical protein
MCVLQMLVSGLSACARPQYVSEQHAALQTPVTLGEGNTGKPPLPPAEVDPGVAAPVKTADFDPNAQPDPTPTDTLAYYQLQLRHCDGEVHVVGAKKVTLERPTTLPSKMGRFAVELRIGRELLERARFDFPLLGAETNDPSMSAQAQFAPKADVSWTVAVAERERTNQAWVVDRLTGKRWDLDWPPGDHTISQQTPDGTEAACPTVSQPAR